jgi:hypothetical protein
MDTGETTMWKAPSAEERRQEREWRAYIADPEGARRRERERVAQAAAARQRQAAVELAEAEAYGRERARRDAAKDERPIASLSDSYATVVDMVRELKAELRDRDRKDTALRERMDRLEKENAELRERVKQPRPLPPMRQWVPGEATLAGEIVAHQGAAWSARRNTGAEPKDGPDWVCASAPGQAGENGRDFRLRGIWSPAKTYRELDVVSHNGGAWAARRDEPGVCPGEGWQCFSMPGKRGPAGETGARGEKGDGVGLLRISAWTIAEGYLAIPELSNGQVGAALDLRPVLERFLMETDRN